MGLPGVIFDLSGQKLVFFPALRRDAVENTGSGLVLYELCRVGLARASTR
jgi:hypothetical protein